MKIKYNEITKQIQLILEDGTISIISKNKKNKIYLERFFSSKKINEVFEMKKNDWTTSRISESK